MQPAATPSFDIPRECVCLIGWARRNSNPECSENHCLLPASKGGIEPKKTRHGALFRCQTKRNREVVPGEHIPPTYMYAWATYMTCVDAA